MNTLKRYMILNALFFTASAVIPQERFELPDALRLENYEFNKSADLVARVQTPSGAFLKYLSDMDGVSNYFAHQLLDEEKQILSKYLAHLPERLSDCIKEHDINIIFVKNFKGAGMVQYVLGASNKLAAFLVLNPKTLTTPLRDWIELRENSPFRSKKKIFLRANLSKDHPAILFTLIHESAHIFDMFHNVTPFVDTDLNKLGLKTKEATRFTKGIWLDYHQPIQTWDFPNRLKARPYGLAPQIDPETILGIYEKLVQTPFISLYSAQTWSEDYAETFTWCYLRKKFDIEYGLTATRNNKVLFDYSPLQRKAVQKKCKNVLES